MKIRYLKVKKRKQPNLIVVSSKCTMDVLDSKLSYCKRIQLPFSLSAECVAMPTPVLWGYTSWKEDPSQHFTCCSQHSLLSCCNPGGHGQCKHTQWITLSVCLCVGGWSRWNRRWLLSVQCYAFAKRERECVCVCDEGPSHQVGLFITDDGLCAQGLL